MAHFRMHTQIREQTSAFLRGFRSLVNPKWLALFSTPEVSVENTISGNSLLNASVTPLGSKTHS